jgi:hypothetical protein
MRWRRSAAVEVQKQAISERSELAVFLQRHTHPVGGGGTRTMEKIQANHTLRLVDVPFAPTPDSVAAARAAQARERAEFTRSTGMRLDRNGQLRRSSLRDLARSRQH